MHIFIETTESKNIPGISEICFFYWVKSTAAMMDCGRKFITTPAQDEWCLRPTFDQKEPQILIPGEEKIKSKE